MQTVFKRIPNVKYYKEIRKIAYFWLHYLSKFPFTSTKNLGVLSTLIEVRTERGFSISNVCVYVCMYVCVCVYVCVCMCVTQHETVAGCA